LPAADLPLLLDAAREAGRIARRFWDRGTEAWEKPGGQGPVTEADLTVDAFLRDRLCEARPGYGWLSEESKDDISRLSCRRVFVVDPIDGTRGFANGEATWAVSVALVEDGLPVAAVVHLPVRGKTYWAAQGHGTFFNGHPVTVSDRDRLEGAHVLANGFAMDPQFWPGGVPPVSRAYRSALSYRLALVAEGRFDAMLTVRDTWEWDIAAGTLLVLEAGGRVSDMHGGPVVFNTLGRHSSGLIAGSPAMHDGLMRHRR